MTRRPSIGAVLLAAGAGARMRSKLAKVLHLISGRPMVEYPIQAARAAGIEQVVVVVNPKMKEVAAHLKRQGARVAAQLRPLGTANAVQVARPFLRPAPEHLVVLYGDVPLVTAQLIERLVRQHLEQQAVCTVATMELDDPTGYGRVIRDDQGRVSAIVEDGEASVVDQMVPEVNTGMYAFQAKALFEALRQITPDRTTREYYLTRAIPFLARQGKVEAILLKGEEAHEALGVNTPEELARVRALMQARLLRQHQERGVTIVDPATTYIEEGVVIGVETVIKPFTYLESGVTIGESCLVGPFARLRQGTVLEREVTVGDFVEIVRSQIGERTKVLHHAYLGDAVVGKGVNVGAGTITANYDGTDKFQTIIEDGAFIGSGTVLVAPAVVRRRGVTGAGAVLTRNTEVPPGKTFVGVPARSIAPCLPPACRTGRDRQGPARP